MKLRSSEHMVSLCDANAQTANSSERGCMKFNKNKSVYTYSRSGRWVRHPRPHRLDTVPEHYPPYCIQCHRNMSLVVHMWFLLVYPQRHCQAWPENRSLNGTERLKLHGY